MVDMPTRKIIEFMRQVEIKVAEIVPPRSAERRWRKQHGYFGPKARASA
jgi:hypothetical protein